MDQTIFELQQGIVSPRDNTVNWRAYEVYGSRDAAKKEARKNKGLWRVVEQRVIWRSQTAIEQSTAGEGLD